MHVPCEKLHWRQGKSVSGNQALINSRAKSSTKVETERKLQQFTVSGWLIMNGGGGGGGGGSEKRKL